MAFTVAENSAPGSTFAGWSTDTNSTHVRSITGIVTAANAASSLCALILSPSIQQDPHSKTVTRADVCGRMIVPTRGNPEVALHILARLFLAAGAELRVERAFALPV